MNLNNRLAPHETFDIHELLVAKTVATTKTSVMVGLVKDEELKTIMEQDFTNSKNQIEDLKGLLNQSVLMSVDSNNTSTTYTVIPEY